MHIFCMPIVFIPCPSISVGLWIEIIAGFPADVRLIDFWTHSIWLFCQKTQNKHTGEEVDFFKTPKSFVLPKTIVGRGKLKLLIYFEYTVLGRMSWSDILSLWSWWDTRKGYLWVSLIWLVLMWKFMRQPLVTLSLTPFVYWVGEAFVFVTHGP